MRKLLLIFLLATAQVRADSTPLIKHILVSAKSDTSDATMVQPSDWNDSHYLDVGKTMSIKDEFVGGLLTTGNIGEKGWLQVNGTFFTIPGVSNHLGVDSMQSATTATASNAFIRFGSTGALPVALLDFWDMTFIVKLSQTNDTMVVRVGFLGSTTTSGNGGEYSDGIYFERDSNETSWFGELRRADVSTRTAALVAQSTNWIKLRIRKKDYDIDSIAFSVNGGTETSLATNNVNMPTNATMAPFVHIGNNNKTKTRAILIDYFQMLVVNMSR